MNVLTDMLDYRRTLIDGQWSAAEGEALDPVSSPATEQVIGHVPHCSTADAARAIGAARRCFDEELWSGMPAKDRVRRFASLWERLDARRADIVAIIMREMGYARQDAEHQCRHALAQLERFLELGGRDAITPLPYRVNPGRAGNVVGTAMIVREPIGVISAITPYNAGFMLAMVKAVAALLMGNTVVLRPSPLTPLETMWLSEMIAELDLPPGAFNVVTGDIDVAQMMCSDPMIDMVSFTGSERVGVEVLRQAAPTIKKVQLELGGKSALIIRHDADLDQALAAASVAYVNAGQGCSHPTRHIVDNRIRPAYVEALAAMSKSIRVGDPLAAEVDMGPLINRAAVERAERYVAGALTDGARLAAGGERPAAQTRGFFFEPTVFDDVDNETALAQEEIFGPVIAVIGYDSDDDAVRMANRSNYGLAGGIVSRDVDIALKMAMRMRTGRVSINNGPGGIHPDMPFGGYKRSGLGREWGIEGLNDFTEIKSIGLKIG